MRIFIAVIIVLFLISAGVIYYFYPTLYGITPDQTADVPGLNSLPTPNSTINSNTTPASETPAETIIAEGLDTPWAIAFLPARNALARNASHNDASGSLSVAGRPDGGMLVTERKGTVRLVDKSGNLQSEPVATLNKVKEIGEGGLLGIALHPDFSSNNYVYFYYTYENQGENTKNLVVRMKYVNGQLADEQIIVDNIPGASNHNGGRIKFGPDNFLYITTGDSEQPSLAQDKNSLAGKILRVTDEGKPAPGNPFNNEVYSYGHRNPQGIAWDDLGRLMETEHGPSGGQYGTGHDELNIVQPGKNYGWPEIIGFTTKAGMERPSSESGNDTWAPGGVAYYQYSDNEHATFFGGLRGQALYALQIKDDYGGLATYFKGKYGRIREVIIGPDNMLYITTSNQDGRGVPGKSDDRIIRINPEKL